MIHFLRPEWLLALLPLALILFFLWRTERVNSSWDRYIAPHLARLLVSTTEQKKSPPLGYLAASWLIAVIALSGPAFTKQSLPVFETAQGRVIIMDMSLSMYASDQTPNRLTQAKFKATDLIDALTEGETGLVAYAGDAFTISPLTRDRATLLNLLPTLSPEIMPVRGSNLVSALEQAKRLLIQGGHIRGDIILLTDDVPLRQIKAAKVVLSGSQYRLGILAFGSKQGAPIRLPEGQLLRDSANQVVVAKTDYAALNELAQDNGGILIPYRADGSDLQQLQTWLSSTDESKATQLDAEVWQDTGPYIALLLLLPVLLSFRQGFLGSLLIFGLVGTLLQPSPAMASSWDDAWQTQDQQAMKAYQKQDFDGASQGFTFPQWQASALYKAGNYDQALALFEQDSSTKGLYNQANCLMQQGQYPDAIKRYEQALAQLANFEPAQKNLELARQLAKQQQSDEQDSDKQSSNKQDSDKQSSDKDKQSDENKDSNKGSDKDSSKGSDQGSKQESDKQQSDAGVKSQEQSGSASEEQSNSISKEQSDSASEEQSNSGADQTPKQQKQQKQQNNDAQMQADANKDEQDKPDKDKSQHSAVEQEQQAKSGAAKTGAEQKATTTAPMQDSLEDLPPAMKRALRALIDDPQVLLRNKMQLEYQKRAREYAQPEDLQTW